MGDNCVKEGCNRVRYKGSLMCRICTTNLRQRDTGPNKASDGMNPGRAGKVTDEQVAEMRRMWARFVPIPEIAAHFGVSRATVHRQLKKARATNGG